MVLTRERYRSLLKSQNFLKPKQRICLCFVSISFLTIILFKQTLNSVEYLSKTLESQREELFKVEKKLSVRDNQEIDKINVNHLADRIYVDVGCFDGETIEHFIHFEPNSSLYDIITFEPDPANYELCRTRLNQEKYQSYRIQIIKKMAWIKDGPVIFLIDKGQQSRIAIDSDGKKTVLDMISGSKGNVHTYLDTNYTSHVEAIDFSSWLGSLMQSENRKLRLKISSLNSEVTLLEKMILDDTLKLVHYLEIEWSDRTKILTRARRIYIQSMIDGIGFDFLFLTQIDDVRSVFATNGSFTTVVKYQDWTKLPFSGTFTHYIQRPPVTDPLRTTRNPKIRRNR